MRLENWPYLLNEAIHEARNKPFKWGEHDCALFSASIVKVITGIDFSEDWKGTYDSPESLESEMKKRGFYSLTQLVDHYLDRVDMLEAMKGDVVMSLMRGNQTLGICVGNAAAFVSDSGLVFHPIDSCFIAWRVK